jgi:hypothetical protein
MKQIWFGQTLSTAKSHTIVNVRIVDAACIHLKHHQIDHAQRKTYNFYQRKKGLHQMKPLFVEPKGFEPLSSCVANYAFYMLIFQLIFGICRAGNRP